MRIAVRVSYNRKMRRGESPAYYEAVRKGGQIIARIWLHPILRKHKDLRDGILKHEIVEIREWARGNTSPDRRANRQEPKVTKKLGGNKGFWQEIERRSAVLN